jgi:hypothetical protein
VSTLPWGDKEATVLFPTLGQKHHGQQNAYQRIQRVFMTYTVKLRALRSQNNFCVVEQVGEFPGLFRLLFFFFQNDRKSIL